MLHRILLIEDQHDVARTLRRALAIRGFSPAVVRSCKEANALCTSRGAVIESAALRNSVGAQAGTSVTVAAPWCFDCAVVDIDLPDGSGIDLASHLLRSCVRSVVFFSGTGDEDLIARARCVGPLVKKSQGFDYLLDELASAVRQEHPKHQSSPATQNSGEHPVDSTLRATTHALLELRTSTAPSEEIHGSPRSAPKSGEHLIRPDSAGSVLSANKKAQQGRR